MENKCLMIKGLRKDLSPAQCLEYINRTAKKTVDILKIAIISREYTPWLTVAVELNTSDYDLLSDINIWENSIGMRDFIGWRHWHGSKPRKLSPQEIKSLVCMSWSPDGGSNI